MPPIPNQPSVTVSTAPRTRLVPLTPPSNNQFDTNKCYVLNMSGGAHWQESACNAVGAVSGSALQKALDQSASQLKQANPGSGAGIGGISGVGGASDTLNLFGGVAGAINSVVDFLKLIGWLFHPQNLLRVVEFLTGGVMIVFGLWAALQARGERLEGFTTSESAISRSGLGRVARDLAANTKGGRGSGGGRRVQSAPHTTRRDALRVRYQREQNIARRGENQRRFGVS